MTTKDYSKMTVDEQLVEWLKGNPIHNDDRQECCPDFSCCQADLLVDHKTRWAFVDASEELRMSMLGIFLGSAIEKMASEKKVYLAGFDDPDTVSEEQTDA